MTENTVPDTSSVPIPVDESEIEPARPGVLVAHAPSGAFASDRFSFHKLPYVLGRGKDSELVIDEKSVSTSHCRIYAEDGEWVIEDTKSRNGTYLNNTRVTGPERLLDSSVIRIGQSVLIFHENVSPMLDAPKKRMGFVGKFHIRALMDTIEKAALTGDHILLAGPSGSGKELASKAIHKIVGEDIPFIAHNSADYGTEDEAKITLLGVAAGTFTDVSERNGCVHLAKDGFLFLDEFHRYPRHVQELLLRSVETGMFRRVGDSQAEHLNIRFILATNAPLPNFGLVPDLLFRFQIVTLLPLEKRRADIPGIFDHFLRLALKGTDIPAESVFACLRDDHYETLCLDGFSQMNVRGLIRFSNLLCGDLKRGTPAPKAVFDAFNGAFEDNLVSSSHRKLERAKIRDLARMNDSSTSGSTCSLGTYENSRSKYEQNKEVILEVYRQWRGNVAATVRALRSKGIIVNERWLSARLKKWKAPTREELRAKKKS